MRARRLPTAVVVAVATHAAAIVAVGRRAPGAREAVPMATVDETWVTMDAPPSASAPSEVNSAAASARGAAGAARGTRTVRGHASAPPAQGEPEAARAAPDAVAEGWSFSATAPTPHGPLPEVPLAAARAGDPGVAPSPREATAQRIERVLRDDLSARDRSAGLGGGAVVTAAHEAAQAATAPETGHATLEIECDAAGTVVASRVLGSDGDPAGWDAVARDLFRRLSARRLPLRPGAHGARMQLRIDAERGERARDEVAPGAIPDDAPGGSSACEGKGLHRRCVAGMPLGFSVTGSGGARAGDPRVVHVWIVGETVL